ncbi:MAG: TonB-dependent receptor [Schleiferiaceae bacterium]|nr:TonB-dependent receptor [Schleiferiaceae bacterium]
MYFSMFIRKTLAVLGFMAYTATWSQSAVSIVVNDNNGRPIAGAQVVAHPENNMIFANEQGEVFFNTLPDSITVFVAGFQVRKTKPPYPRQFALNPLRDSIQEVVITATRTELSVVDVPVPMRVVGSDEIEQMGALRLQDVLSEQTGLQLISNHGTGLQMQGLSSDYILILIDDEPVIGRTAGTLNLNRLAVGNIERIEILKGPGSSLYGSEAMAGVINIITKQPKEDHALNFTTSYRKFNTADLGINYGMKGKKWRANVLANRFHTDGVGFDTPEGRVQLPQNTSYTFQPKLHYTFNKNWDASINLRGFTENQEQQFSLELGGTDAPIPTTSFGRLNEFNTNIRINYRKKGSHLQIRPYHAYYNFQETLLLHPSEAIFEESSFTQHFSRMEAQFDQQITSRQLATIGGGINPQSVEATRFSETGQFFASYLFFQHQWEISDRLRLQSGARYDWHNAYENRLSPKIAAQFVVKEDGLRLNASIGSGYKAPDFRQLLLDFNNSVAGYAVLGSNHVAERLAQLQAQGRIQAILWDTREIGKLRPETSWTIQMGFHQPIGKKWCVQGHVFHHLINDLIETTPVARQTNGQTIFSYRNVNQVRSQGFELQIDGRVAKAWTLSAGYQFLDMKDMTVVADIEAGSVFRRLPGGSVTRVSQKDYLGLFNRSRHSGNAKVFYTRNNWQFSVRAIYRGAFPFGDTNGNQIADTSEELASGNLLLNVMISKTLKKQFQIETGVNNLLNQTNLFEPSVFGMQWFVGFRWNVAWSNKSNS